MFTLILTVFYLSYGVAVATVPGFRSAADCDAAGKAWVAQNDSFSRAPRFLCVKH